MHYHIFSLVQFNEKKAATNREVHLLIVDLNKAYDTAENLPVPNIAQDISESSPEEVDESMQWNVVIAQDTEDLEFMARRLFREYEDWDLSVNRTKTQYLCVGSDKVDDLQVDQHTHIEEYTYLGTSIYKGG
ncbi:hypothetical protein HUJ04_001531 [Dendroctonus ponderosae]|nr:hypothetical protein HUJ04_001531 [Dendroctonus ponderosae]